MTTETLQDTRPYRSLAREELEARGPGLEADLAELEAGYSAQAAGYSVAALRNSLGAAENLPGSDAKKPEWQAKWVRERVHGSAEYAELRRLRDAVMSEELVLHSLDGAVTSAEKANARLAEATGKGWHYAEQWLRHYGDGLVEDATRAHLVREFRQDMAEYLETDVRAHTLARVQRLVPVAMGANFNNPKMGSHGYAEYADASAARWFIATVEELLAPAQREVLVSLY